MLYVFFEAFEVAYYYLRLHCLTETSVFFFLVFGSSSLYLILLYLSVKTAVDSQVL